MGCGQSTNQVAPSDLYADRPEKVLPVDARSSASPEDKSAVDASNTNANGNGNGSADDDSGCASGHRRRSSASSNLSFQGSLPGSSSDFVPMAQLDRFSIDTTRAKSNLSVVSLCAQKLGLQELTEGRSDGKGASIYWHSVVYGDMKAVVRSPESRVNKFPGMTELAKKISLTHSIASMQELFPEEYNFYPRSWVVPAQLPQFQSYCAGLQHESKWFIVKPDDGAQGTGIYLIQSPTQLVNSTERQLIQEYIDEPFLMPDQLKFDFRVYAVIKSLNPLSIYIAREGMARFCTEKYAKPTTTNFDNLFSHLTNYSLNKESAAYVHSNSLKDQLKGSKRLLSTVFHQMETHGVRTRRLWHNIKMIVVKTVLAMVPEIMLNYEHYFSDVPGPQCFQIMGFDIIVRKDATPMLLEVNSAPSLSIDHNVPSGDDSSPPVRSIVDEMIKMPLVRDTLLLVLDQLEHHYHLANNANDWDTKSLGSMASGCEDDLAVMKRKKRPHLSQIFPGRYGSASKHLLFLDKAVYLFMQFTSIRLGMTINLTGVKSFVKKCSLTNTVNTADVEKKYAEINFYLTGKENNLITGLPFHGFLQLLFFFASRKFGYCDDLLAAMQRLLAYCDSALRHYGVRSGRLRRTEVETDENANEIYLLPSRLRPQKAGASALSHRTRSRLTDISMPSPKVLAAASAHRTKSLPRRQPGSALTSHNGPGLPPVRIVH